MVGGSLEDKKLEDSIKRSILRIERTGLEKDKTYESRKYWVKVISISSGFGQLYNMDYENYYIVTHRNSGTRYIVRHCFENTLRSGNKKGISYWIFIIKDAPSKEA